jgi:hypothetical protein
MLTIRGRAAFSGQSTMDEYKDRTSNNRREYTIIMIIMIHKGHAEHPKPYFSDVKDCDRYSGVLQRRCER